MIEFYCGIGEMNWNHHPVATGRYACVSPVYGNTEETHRVNRVAVPQEALIFQDSGAFSDGPANRLSFSEALDRQIEHAEQFRYISQVTARASYDLLIDERWQNGVRSKLRWDASDAEFASRISVRAAAYLSEHRYGVPLILSAQGVTPRQYLKCSQQIIPLMEEQDIFGLGGWCILGKIPSLLPSFYETMRLVIPFLAKEQVKRVHIWGVCFSKALNDLLWVCNQHGIIVSTDSVGPSTKPVMGEWGYADWRDNTYRRPDILETCKSGEHHLCVRCRGLERARHVALTREWLANFQPKCPVPYQLSLMEELEDIA